MMFGWLRRRQAPPVPRKQPRAAVPPRSPEAEAAPPGPAPLPEVVAEGNTQADWSAWEDSMTALDSQVGELEPGARVHVRDTRPSRLDELDPFSSIGQKRR